MRILIAEDDFTSRTTLAGILKKNGHEAVEAMTGSEASKVLQKANCPMYLHCRLDVARYRWVNGFKTSPRDRF